MKEGGFTLVELLIAIFFLLVAVIGIVGVSVLTTRTSFQVERKVISQSIANSTIEKLHALSYSEVGAVPSGATLLENGSLPYGSVEYQETIHQNGQDYIVTTDVIPIDDPANGTLSGLATITTADYKNIRVQVTPSAALAGGQDLGVVSAVTTISNWPPQACVPGDPTACSVSTTPMQPNFVFENPGQMRSFVNSLGQFALIPTTVGSNEGVFAPDTATEQKLCDLKGYSTVTGVTQETPTQLGVYVDKRWDSSTNTFVTVPVQDQPNPHLATLECGDPKTQATCSYPIACPASGKCSDAYLERGYTPTGSVYSSTCKSSADCASGYVCNTGSGLCEVPSSAKYQYATSEDPKVAGQASDCTTKYPPGGGWTLRDREALACSGGVCNRDICLWRKPVSDDRQYYFKEWPGTSACSASDSAVSGSTLISSGCADPNSSCPAYDPATGKTTKADYCFYEKLGSPAASDLTLTHQAGTTSEPAYCASVNPYGGPAPSQNVTATITISDVYNTKDGDTTPTIYFGTMSGFFNYGLTSIPSGQSFDLVKNGTVVTDPYLPGEVPGISVQRRPGYIIISIDSDKTDGQEGAKGTITINGSTFTSMLTSTQIIGLENTSGEPAELGSISRDEAVITSPTEAKFTFTAGPDRDNFALFFPTNAGQPNVANPSRACVDGGTSGAPCVSDICLWRNANQCSLPVTSCTIAQYNAAKNTLPESQGWVKNVTPSAPGLDVSAIQTDAPSGKKYFTMTDQNSSGFLDYTYPGIDESLLIDQDWTYEATVRVRTGDPQPLAIGPFQTLVAGGMKYINAIFETGKIGAMGTSASPYAYAVSANQDTATSFATYTISHHKHSAGVFDDAYDISVNGTPVPDLTGIRRSESYTPGSGEFSQGVLFGFPFAPSQGSVDVSSVLFKSGLCL